jgi:hypothetical protein
MSRLDMPLGARKDNTHADDSGPWRTLRGARFAQYPVWAKGLPGSDRPDSSLWGLTAKASVESGRHTLADPYPAGGVPILGPQKCARMWIVSAFGWRQMPLRVGSWSASSLSRGPLLREPGAFFALNSPI